MTELKPKNPEALSVQPNDENLAKYKVDATKLPEIYSALSEYDGKTILLVRQATYICEEQKASIREERNLSRRVRKLLANPDFRRGEEICNLFPQ